MLPHCGNMTLNIDTMNDCKGISVWRDRGALETLWFQCAVYKSIYLLTYLLIVSHAALYPRVQCIYQHSHALLQRTHSSVMKAPSPPTDSIWWLSGGKREDYQNCSVLYCVLKLCTVISTLRWAVLTVLWIGFYHTGSISLCADSAVFMCVYFVFFFCQLHMCYIIVTWWCRPDGIEA